MCKRRHILLLLAAALLAGAVIVALIPAREPSYGGRKLSEWLRLYMEGGRPAQEQARHAIRQIGTNAIPFLLRWIQYEPWGLKGRIQGELAARPGLRTAVEKLEAHRRIQVWLSTDKKMQLSNGAINAFGVLGRDAKSAFPELVRLASNRRATVSAWQATYALTQIGMDAEVLPLFMADLRSPQVEVRRMGAGNIALLATNARPAVPLLIQCLTNERTYCEACYSLGELKLEPDLVVPALTRAVQSSNFPWPISPLDRAMASTALSKFGPEASSAVPALLNLLTNSYFHTREQATNALLKIAPQALTNAIHR
jgi:hypothetical protein